MSQFKPGDLALTLKDAVRMPAMSQVEIVKRIDPQQTYKDISGRKFQFDGVFWMVERDSRKFAFHQSLLMPLRGDPAPEQQKLREVVL